MNNKAMIERSKNLRKKVFQSVYYGNGGHIDGQTLVDRILSELHVGISK